MDIQKEREDFEKLWTDGNGHFKFFKFDQDDCKYQLNGVTDNLSKEDLLSASITLNTAWLFWLGAKKRAVPEGFVLVPKDQFESLNEFKGLYKRAIINARKRKDQLNWAHVAGLGVGSGRAVELCKMLNIDPSATNMHEVIEAQEQKG